MSGSIAEYPVSVEVKYDDPWMHKDAQRLIFKPMTEEMFAACAEIAKKYGQTPGIEVTIV